MSNIIINPFRSVPVEMGADHCDHGIKFDLDMAEKMSASEIRKAFPRLNGACPKGCGFSGIAYVSKAHFIYGDW